MLRYEFSIKGMKCSNCSNKVETVLREMQGVKSSSINLITEIGMIAIEDDKILDEIKSNIIKMGFKISPFKRIETSTNNKMRPFTLNCSDIKAVQEALQDKVGISSINQHTQDIIKIEYDPNLIKGWEIYDILQQKSINFTYVNELINNLNDINNFSTSITKKKFIVCVILTALLITNSMILPKLFIGELLMSTFLINGCLSVFLFLSLILSFIIIVLYGLEIIIRSFKGFWYFRMLNMETLISLGSLSSLCLTFLNLTRLFYIYYDNDKSELNKVEMYTAHSVEAAATVISISIIGKYIEETAKLNIRRHTSMMFSKEKLAFGVNAVKIKPGNKSFTWFLSEKKVDVGLLEKDDFVKINLGDFLLYDGIIMNGEIQVNESMTYGFEKIDKKAVGDRIKSGCEVEKGSCVISVTEVLEDSVLYKVTKEMNESLNQKLNFQIFIDRIIVYFVPLIIGISIITLLVWILIYIFNSKGKDYLTLIFVFERAISVLVVSCPCAFGLAIPTVTTISLNTALKNGILIKNLSLLPEIKNTENVVFDKTGTLTEIKKEVKIEYENEKVNKIPVYTMIAACEKDHKHPLAAILYSYSLKKINSEESNTISLSSEIEKDSRGLSAKFICSVDNKSYLFSLGNKKYSEEKIGKAINNEDLKIDNIANSSMIYITVNEEILLVISIDTSTEIRKEAYQIVNLLKELNKNIFILSGDKIESVKSVGLKLGISEENIFGEVDNKKKKEFFLNLKKTNTKSMMIGDGMNDILSLSEADFGISFNAASQLNLVAADIIFIKEDLRLIFILLKLSKLTFIFIWINIFWAFFYNICLLPITSGAFHSFWNVEMSPTLSSFSMLCSSLFIILTSHTLKLFSLMPKKSKKLVNPSNYVSLKVDEQALAPSVEIIVQEGTKRKNGNYYEFE
jgi:Cu+-exporting ATPase